MEDIKAVALVDIPEYTGLDKEVTLAPDGEWKADRWGQNVGRIKHDGTVESFFKKDIDNGNTEIFDKLRKDVELIEISRTVMNKESDQIENYRYCYIPYKIVNHCSDMPTVTHSYVDGCSNVKYDVTYEIVLAAGENFTKYITIDYKTSGSYSSTVFDQIGSIEDTFDEFFDENINGFSSKKGYKTVDFYNNVGEKSDIEINSTHELLSMISSIRVIKLDSEIVENKKEI